MYAPPSMHHYDRLQKPPPISGGACRMLSSERKPKTLHKDIFHALVLLRCFHTCGKPFDDVNDIEVRQPCRLIIFRHWHGTHTLGMRRIMCGRRRREHATMFGWPDSRSSVVVIVRSCEINHCWLHFDDLAWRRDGMQGLMHIWRSIAIGVVIVTRRRNADWRIQWFYHEPWSLCTWLWYRQQGLLLPLLQCFLHMGAFLL